MKVKSKLSLVDRIIWWLNCFLCIALLISYLAPVADPKKAWFIAFFGLAYPFLLMANLIMIAYWLVRKKWYFLLSIICIACGWNVLNNNIGFRKPTTDPALKSGKIIRMMTYNVHNFKRYGSKNDVSTKQEILQIINQQQPDIIGIQEFYTRGHGKYDMRDSILKIMASDFYYFEPILSNNEEAIGIAIFSKFPIIDHGIIPISDKLSVNACIYVDLKKGDQQLRVYSVHLRSIGFDPQDYKYINGISDPGKTDISSTRRLGSKLKNAFIKRSDQVIKIKEHAAQCPYPYIIAGDFNDTPASYSVNEMSRDLKNAFHEKGVGFGRTYNGDFPNFQIDYIMASPQFDVKNYLIIEKKLSDHYAVRSDLQLK
jgi:endonuclease/exonuclease/phosphatase family metal-dependent hydrolase